MTAIMAEWNKWLEQRMFLVVLVALSIGFNLSIPKSASIISIGVGLFAYMTFVTALGISFKDFIKVINRPWVPLWILLLIHVAAPFIAWIIGSVFYPHDQFIRSGLIIGSSIPVAVTSIIWTSLTGGNVALSLVVVTLDTLILPVIYPVFFLITLGQVLSVDYLELVVRLMLMVTIPSIAGMLINDVTKGRLDGFSKSVGGFTSKVALFLVILLNAMMVASEIQWDASLVKLLLVVFLLVSCGYLLGFAGSFALKERSREMIFAMVYNVGMRNISFGLLLALTYFPPSVVVPITLAMLFQQPAAAIIANLFRRKSAGLK
ncbi:MAG: bile acid:sodium symporter family protein [Firmicutes bacterium]|nr:bile acid:sodium symporter family protein [Bacillota bacterium]